MKQQNTRVELTEERVREIAREEAETAVRKNWDAILQMQMEAEAAHHQGRASYSRESLP